MTSSQYGLYALGYTRVTMAGTKGCQPVRGEPISKNLPQFGLESAIRLHEAGIASNGRSARSREYVPGSCTHRPSSDESRGHPKSYVDRPKVKLVIGAKS